MLTNDYRPRRFLEIVGQRVPVSILKSSVKNPEHAIRSMIFDGAFGTGKTSLSRIFAKALNCKGRAKSDHEPCGSCVVCLEENTFTAYYQEYDCAMVGNVESVRELREDLFSASAIADWRVVVLDEFHLASKSAQSALLKVLESLPSNVFCLFCTTDGDKILSTIKSRSIDLKFEMVSVEDIQENLFRIVRSETIEVTDDVVKAISVASR